jgi:hypothetical protein
MNVGGNHAMKTTGRFTGGSQYHGGLFLDLYNIATGRCQLRRRT